MSNFTHLHVHSHYSLLDGLAKIDDLLEKAKKYKMDSLALTDHGVMYGAIEFYQKAINCGIKPLIGVEAYIAPNSRNMKRPRIDTRPYHIVLIAENLQGYQNLLKLTSIAHMEGFYYKPRIDFEILKKYNQGIIALSACLEGEIPRQLLSHNYEMAEEAANRYQQIFGKENFYLEVQDHPNLANQVKVNEKIIELSKSLKIPLVATNDTHYLNSDDDKVHDVLMCIQTQKTVNEKNRISLLGHDLSLRTPEDMITSFSHIPEAIENTNIIADRCNFEIELKKTKLPYYPIPDRSTDDEYIRKLCYLGLKKKYGIANTDSIPNNMSEETYKEIIERLEYELSVIEKTKFSSYFLIVQDLVNWAKNHEIVVGPGRGSAGGSLVAYLLNITDVDPIKYKLLFERFLNPERISMPDIDLDFADTRRDEVIKYVKEKYGEKRVAQIITFGTMAARAAVRDCGRALGYPYDYCDKVAKMIPMFNSLDKALETVPELKDLYTHDPQATKLLNFSKKLEGVARHASTHACGTVISAGDLDDFMPIQYASQDDKTVITQYEMHGVEDLGLLKMDFLGLKNLTIIENALKIIAKVHKIKLETKTFPLDDKSSYELFQKGNTTGIFQFESAGMKRYLKQLKPTEFEDLIAMVALYRPGPMDWIPDYISGKHGKKKIAYIHPKLEPILNQTYGVAIYQEQVMQIARDLAGFTLAEADVLRKAVGKKIKELLMEQKKKFINGCIANDIEKVTAEKIFNFIEPFAGYGFNRSHAACYAMIAYQTAYLKAHYPTEFMASLLTADQENTDRVSIEISECDQMGIDVLPPDVNESFATFAVVPNTKNIRFAFSAIKNLGHSIIERIIEERKANGKYVSLDDFLQRVSSKELNKKSLESLAKSGALDKFAERKKILGNIETILEYIKNIKKANDSGQTDLFGGINNEESNSPKIKLEEIEPADKHERLSWEKELMGLYISEHPIDEFREYLIHYKYLIKDIRERKSGEVIKVAGIITKAKSIITRSNESMLFAQIDDGKDTIEAIVFPSVLKQNTDIWQENKLLLIEGKLNDRDDELKILCEHANILNKDLVATWQAAQAMRQNINAPHPAPDNIKLTNNNVLIKIPTGVSPEVFNCLKNIFENNQGKNAVTLKVLDKRGAEKEIKTDFFINYNEDIKKEINFVLNKK